MYIFVFVSFETYPIFNRLGLSVVGELVYRGGGSDCGQEVVGWLGPTGGGLLGPGVVGGAVVGARCGGWWGSLGL